MKLSDNAGKRIGIFLVLPILLTTLAYAGGYISQFIINYKVWTAAGETPGNGTAPRFPSGSPSACFQALAVFLRDLPVRGHLRPVNLPCDADGIREPGHP